MIVRWGLGRRARWVVLALSTAGFLAGCAIGATLLAQQGLERADQWSSVIQLFVGPILALVSIAVAVVTARSPTPPPSPPSSGQASSAPVVHRPRAGRDINIANDMTFKRPESER